MHIREMRARRAELLQELARLDEAIRMASSGQPVRLALRRNLRNTGWLTVKPSSVDAGYILAYADESMTGVADTSSHDVWIAPEDAAAMMADGRIDGDSISVY